MINNFETEFENTHILCPQYIKCGEIIPRWLLECKGQCMKCEQFQFEKGECIYKKITKDNHDCPICLEQDKCFRLSCQHYICWKCFYDLHYYELNEEYMLAGTQFETTTLKNSLSQENCNSEETTNHQNHVESYNKNCFDCFDELQDIICSTHLEETDPTCPCCYTKYTNHYLGQHEQNEFCELCLYPNREDQNKLLINLQKTSKCPICRSWITEQME